MSPRRIAKVRVELIKEKNVYCKSQEISTPERAAEFARSLYYDFSENELKCMPRECMIVCSIDTKSKPVIIEYVSVGTANSAVVDMKSIFMSAILANADGIIVFHNHPSGNPAPSIQDNLITNKIREAGKLLDIPLRDHIIVGDSGFYSYVENGVCPWKENEIYEKAG